MSPDGCRDFDHGEPRGWGPLGSDLGLTPSRPEWRGAEDELTRPDTFLDLIAGAAGDDEVREAPLKHGSIGVTK